MASALQVLFLYFVRKYLGKFWGSIDLLPQMRIDTGSLLSEKLIASCLFLVLDKKGRKRYTITSKPIGNIK